MPKQFYTEKDIEDLFRRGIKSLQVTDEVILTELAYEKAGRLGLVLLSDRPDNPPAAPVRPYLLEGSAVRPKPGTGSVTQASPSAAPSGRDASAIEQRIRSAVIAKLGDQVDAKLLDHIIHRVLKSTGLK